MKHTRELLGMTQPELAAFLGVTKSVVSMAESSLRTLSTAALIEYSRFEQLVNQAAEDKNLPPAASGLTKSEQVEDVLQKHREECRWQVQIAQKKLDRLFKTREQNLLKLKVAALMKAARQKEPTQEYTACTACEMERTAANKLKANGDAQIALLTLKIAGWRQQAADADTKLQFAKQAKSV